MLIVLTLSLSKESISFWYILPTDVDLLKGVFYAYACFSWIYVNTACVCDALGGQKRMQREKDILEDR